MPARARNQIVDENEPGLYHCFSRCVRRAFLCGQDEYTGKNYDHRKQWIEERLEFLAGQMAIDVTGHSILSNHLHVVLRNRPDLSQQWSEREVARRWLTLCPGKRKLKSNEAAEGPSDKQIDALVKNKKKLHEVRRRLSSLSWFMKFTKEHISRRANEEDGVSGTFWEGRFRSIRLLDDFAIMLCSMYVDLNPIRAGMAQTPETSVRTSVYLRIQALLGRQSPQTQDGEGSNPDPLAAAWLAPIDVDAPPPDGAQSEQGRRASDKGFLEMSLEKYLQLLDWSGREVRAEKRGAIPLDLAPIVERLGITVEHWVQGLQSFCEWFGDFAGRPSTLKAHAAAKGFRWLRGMR
jgi:hypothetical protein